MGAEVKVTSRDYNREPSRIKKTADTADVIITERGRPTHVMLSYDEYRKLKGKPLTLHELAETWSEVPESAEIDACFEAVTRRKAVSKPFRFD